VSPDPSNPIVRFHRVTEPVLRPVRNRCLQGIGLDLSMIVLLIIYVLTGSWSARCSPRGLR
jgi:uncharacterized protein YggT (Ycf19 family)